MYIVIELQKTGDQIANIVTTHADQNEAESRYHQVLAAAAVSAVPVHACAMLSEEGFPLRYECYKHETAAAVEVEEVTEEV